MARSPAVLAQKRVSPALHGHLHVEVILGDAGIWRHVGIWVRESGIAHCEVRGSVGVRLLKAGGEDGLGRATYCR